MDPDIYCEWFFQEFVPSVKEHLMSLGLPHKAILLLDSASYHPKDNELVNEGIKVMFLSTNSTYLC